MIRHIYTLFTLAPTLRCWSYYCFYCLQAILVILLKVADDQHRSRRHQPRNTGELSHLQPSVGSDRDTMEEDRMLCNLAVEVFERMKLKASQRCADVVRRFLDKWGPENIMNGSDALHSRSSLKQCGTLQASSSIRRRSAIEHSTQSSLQLDHPVVRNVEEESVSIPAGTARTGPSGAESARSVDGSSSTSPQVSLNGLQAELYGALYSNDLDDLNAGFHFGEQSCLFGAEAPGDCALGLGMDDTTDGSWSPYNRMQFYDDCRQPDWSEE